MVRRAARVGLSLPQQIAACGLEAPLLEVLVCAGRKFRFDLAWPARKLACEVDGAVWVNGRHSRGGGVQRDCEKFSLAAIHGWRVMRVTTDMVRSGKALALVEQALGGPSSRAVARGASIGGEARARRLTPTSSLRGGCRQIVETRR